LTDEILSERAIEYFVKEWTLLPSKGGVFELTVNGELVFSKKQMKRHAEPGEIRAAIMRVLDTLRPPDFVLPDED
jgi:selenoprotein W-related protein